MHKVFFSIGGNIGDRQANLVKAITEIGQRVGKILVASSIYETKAWGIENQPDFLNQVLLVETALTPLATLETILTIELEMGRIRAQKWYTRIIDIDLLFFDDQIITSQQLTIPHPFLAKRNFVLAPLAEIAPDFIHPVLQKSIKALYLDSKDPLKVWALESSLS